MNSHFFCRAFAIACLGIILQAGSPANAADSSTPSAGTKTAPAKTTSKVTPTKKTTTKKAAHKTSSANAKKTPVSATGDPINDKLLAFGQTTLNTMNRCILPCATKKEVTQNADGSYSGRYKAVDLATLKTRYSKPESSKAITYVGYMTYDELEYRSTGKTKNEALSGPFTVSNRQNMTELVKYVGGKWTY